MSGIAAIYNRTRERVEVADVRRLLDGMAWRGPDQQGYAVDGSVGIAAVQLWTVPEDLDTEQPIRDGAGRIGAFDGRLVNRGDLLRLLQRHQPRADLDDASLAMLAYAEWGARCVERFVGPYAFVVWDPKATTLFAARDPLGLRTLFYRLDADRAVIASTLRQFADACRLDAVDDRYVWEYLCSTFHGAVTPQLTPFRRISRLPAGHRLSVTPTTSRVEAFWKPSELTPLTYRNRSEYAEHLRELLEAVVAAQLRAAGPVGITVSGGVDSASVASLAAHMRRRGAMRTSSLHALTFAWKQTPGYDEADYAASVTRRHPELQHHVLFADDVSPLGDLALVQDEPWLQYYGPWSLVATAAARSGCRVVMTGAGGDELFQGNLYVLADLARRGRFVELARSVKACAREWRAPYQAFVLNWVLPGLVPKRWAEPARQRFAHPMDPGEPRDFWDPPPWVATRRPPRPDVRDEAVHRSVSGRLDFETALLGARDNTRLWEAQYILLPNGVEERQPFFDVRVVEFALRIPPEAKVLRTLRKAVLRDALADILPEEVAMRPGKTGYDFAFFAGLKRSWPAVSALVSESRAAEMGYIDLRRFRDEVNVHRYGGGRSGAGRVLATLALEVWLRQLAGESVRAGDSDAPVPGQRRRRPATGSRLTSQSTLREEVRTQ